MADTFTDAYIAAALWSSTDFGDDGEVRSENMEGEELAAETQAEMEEDCADFQQANAELLLQWYDGGESEERAGHDFWLTRCGHGAGFWDRYSGDQLMAKIGDALSDAAKVYGSRDLYVGDDGLVYQS